MNRNADSRKEGDLPAELESQFVLRLPVEPAKVLRELIQSGANNLKDRLSIRIENDMRTGEVRIDDMLLHAKVVDFPTILESLKTIDNKTFYKTADICQMLLCKEDDDQTLTDEDTPSKTKKKDPNKVDKKFLFPHGLTPPMKNVRKRRFRKTLKKKYVEAPEIEKEVKRLLRVDNEAVNVKWEVINEEEEKMKNVSIKEEQDSNVKHKVKKEPASQTNIDVGEHDIFGGAVSDSEEETNINIMEIEDTSRLSADDSRLSDTQSQEPNSSSVNNQQFVTHFSREMFSRDSKQNVKLEEEEESLDYDNSYHHQIKPEKFNNDGGSDTMSKQVIKDRMDSLQKDLDDLKSRRLQQELEVANIENMALRQRFQDILDNLLTEQLQKEHEYEELKNMLNKR